MKKPSKIRYRELLDRPPTPARGSDALPAAPAPEASEPAPAPAPSPVPIVAAEVRRVPAAPDTATPAPEPPEPPEPAGDRASMALDGDAPADDRATPTAPAPTPTPTTALDAEYLVFRVGQELFALPLDAVDEAIDIDHVQPIPETSATMLGVLSLRGALVPVYAPSAALGVAAETRAAALVFATPRGLVALAVDDVDDVMPIPLAALQRAPVDFGDGVLVGVARRDGDLIGVLDATALLAACRAEPVLETA